LDKAEITLLNLHENDSQIIKETLATGALIYPTLRGSSLPGRSGLRDSRGKQVVLTPPPILYCALIKAG